MNFGEALDALRRGRAVFRMGWNGPGQHVKLQLPDEHSKMTTPYLYIVTTSLQIVPWAPSQTDVLANDWEQTL